MAASAVKTAPEIGWRSVLREFGSVVCIATADIDAPLWTNKQHIAVRLAEVVPTLYVESLGLRMIRLSRRDVRRATKRLTGVGSAPRSSALPEGLAVLSPLVVPLHGVPGISALNRAALAAQLRPHIAALPRPRLLWAYSPLTSRLIDLEAFDVIAYHCVDDLATQPRMPATVIRAGEADLARRAAVVFCSAPALADRLRHYNDRTRVTSNVSDWSHFAQTRETVGATSLLGGIPAPRAVFVGALSDYKVDWDLLDRVVRLRDDWSFVFVGPQGDENRMTGWRKLVYRPNCHFLGAQPYAVLPKILADADVGLLPYRLTEHTRSVFPLKTTEYLAAGLPVVATRLESLAADPSIPVLYASGPDEFAAAIARADRTLDARAERSAYARAHTWDALLDAMFAEVADVVSGRGSGRDAR
jgi:glycosyltransferase involved in cell wall biosynthesis